MERRMSLFARAIAAISIGLIACAGGSAVADETGAGTLARQLAGAWLLSSDRDKEIAVGENAKGSVILDGGSFALQMVSADLPKIAAEDRSLATADESAAVTQQTLSYFGTYDLDEAAHSLVLHIYYSSYANWRDMDQKWTVTLNADQMSWMRPGSSAATLVWLRAPQGSAVATRGRHY
jgi:hypothetical protein